MPATEEEVQDQTTDVIVGEPETKTQEDPLDIVDPIDLDVEGEDEEQFPSLADKGEDDDSAADESDGDDAGETDEVVLDEQLVAAAEQLDIPREQLEKWGDKAVDMVLYLTTKVGPAGAGKKAGSKADDDTVDDEEFEEFKLDIDPDADIEPDVLEKFKNMNTHYNKAVSSLRKQHKSETGILRDELSKVIDHLNGRSQEAYESRYDEFINDLGEEWETEFGKGSLASLDRSSSHYANRLKVDKMVNVLWKGYAASGDKAPSEKKLLMQAVRGVFGDKTETIARRSVTSKVKKRSSQITERPTQRNRSPDKHTVRKQSIANVAAKIKELGMDDDED